MSRQRGVVLLMALGLSLLLGLLAAQVLHEAQARQRLAGEQLAVARAFEQAEAGLLEGAALLPGALPPPCVSCLPPAIPPGAGTALAANRQRLCLPATPGQHHPCSRPAAR